MNRIMFCLVCIFLLLSCTNNVEPKAGDGPSAQPNAELDSYTYDVSLEVNSNNNFYGMYYESSLKNEERWYFYMNIHEKFYGNTLDALIFSVILPEIKEGETIFDVFKPGYYPLYKQNINAVSLKTYTISNAMVRWFEPYDDDYEDMDDYMFLYDVCLGEVHVVEFNAGCFEFEFRFITNEGVNIYAHYRSTNTMYALFVYKE